MHSLRRSWTLVALAAGVLGTMLSLALGGAFGTPVATGAAPAATPSSTTATTQGAAASSIFGCRASLARVVLMGNLLTEPAVANPNQNGSPCVDDTKAVQSVDTLGAGSPLNFGKVGPAGETTYQIGSLGGQTSPAATAISNVNALTLTLPGGYTITAAGPLLSQAAVECVGTALKTQGSSNLTALTISGPGLPSAGRTFELGQYANQVLVNLPAALGTITANAETKTPTSLTESLLTVQLAGNAGEIVVGESQISVPNPAICLDNAPPTPTTVTSSTTVYTPTTITQPGTTTTITGSNGTATTVTEPGKTTTVTQTTTTSTTTTIPGPSGSVPTSLQQCAPGSSYDPASGNCVIYDNGQPIFVSKPFQGPTGGVVITLTNARKHYHSPCLYGSGPGWVLIVKGVGTHATGTPKSDRILGFDDRERIAGLSGDDCIDAMGPRAYVLDGNGSDRDYVTSGYNRVVVGNGRDFVYGRHASGWMTIGTGPDHIYGGSAGMRIDAYGNHKTIYGGAGRNRIWSNSAVAQIYCGGNPRTVLFARKVPRAFARAHGHCATVLPVR